MGFFDTFRKKKKNFWEKTDKQSVSAPSAVRAPDNSSDGNSVVAKKKKPVRMGGNAHATLFQPYVSEKAGMEEAQGKYTFVVALGANKTAIKQAVRDVYGVLPTTVRIVNMQGKFVRMGRKIGKRSDWKKAIVTLPKGQSIAIHGGV